MGGIKKLDCMLVAVYDGYVNQTIAMDMLMDMFLFIVIAIAITILHRPVLVRCL